MFVHSANISLGFWGRHDRQGAQLCVKCCFVNFGVSFPTLINILIFSPGQRLGEEKPETKNWEAAKPQAAADSKDEAGRSDADLAGITALCTQCPLPWAMMWGWNMILVSPRMGIACRTLTSCPGAESNGALSLPILPSFLRKKDSSRLCAQPKDLMVLFCKIKLKKLGRAGITKQKWGTGKNALKGYWCMLCLRSKSSEMCQSPSTAAWAP